MSDYKNRQKAIEEYDYEIRLLTEEEQRQMEALDAQRRKAAISLYEKDVLTNADRIRAMTDEELAEWLSDMHDAVTCPNGGAIDCKPSCKRCWLDWLKQEVEDGKIKALPV